MGCLIELLCVLQVECGSFGLLILTFFLSFVFLYFWSEAQNDYNDFDWFVLSTLTNTDKCSHINVLPLAHMSGEETFTLYFPTDWQMVAGCCWVKSVPNKVLDQKPLQWLWSLEDCHFCPQFALKTQMTCLQTLKQQRKCKLVTENVCLQSKSCSLLLKEKCHKRCNFYFEDVSISGLHCTLQFHNRSTSVCCNFQCIHCLM